MDFMGGSSIVWLHQHNIGHHPNSNREGTAVGHDIDPDTQSGAPIVRLSPGQPWRPHHQYQHIYVWVMFGAVTFKWSLNDFKAFFRRKYAMIDMFELTRGDFLQLTVGKLVFFFYVILVPLYFHPLWKVITMFVLMMMSVSYWFVLMFSVNHMTAEAIFPSETDDRDWARLQVLTATNYAVGSTLWTWLSGALNYQIEHHLFPSIPHTYLPLISPIVQKTCKEFEVPYKSYDSYFTAIHGHYLFLKHLGEKPSTVSNGDHKKNE